MKKKLILLSLTLALVFAVAAVMTGCGDDEKAEKKETKNITMCLDWTPNTNHSGIYAALSKGYFEDEGLKVKVVQPPENGAASMVASGKAEFGVDAQDTTAPAIIGKDKLPITTVAAILQHNTSGIVSLKEKGITSPGKMAGHTYATWDNPVEQAMLKQLVTEDNGDFSKVKMIILKKYLFFWKYPHYFFHYFYIY
jgi:ABC-type nitrate/sulfonate/bicarbonate transport system substrate-binding protein